MNVKKKKKTKTGNETDNINKLLFLSAQQLQQHILTSVITLAPK